LEGTNTVAVFVKVPENQHDTPVGSVATRFTLPENPLRLVTEMTVCLSEATGIACDVGLSEMVKSAEEAEFTFTVRIVVWDTEPLVPFTVIV